MVDYIPIRQADLPGNPTPATVRRWIRHGTPEGARLRAIRVGGRYFTSQEWVDDFVATLSLAVEDHTISKRHQSDAANRFLKECGLW